MQMTEILNYAFPYTDEDLQDERKHYDKTLQRDRLRRMVDAYKNGEVVHFEALSMKIDIEEILKRFNN